MLSGPDPLRSNFGSSDSPRGRFVVSSDSSNSSSSSSAVPRDANAGSYRGRLRSGLAGGGCDADASDLTGRCMSLGTA